MKIRLYYIVLVLIWLLSGCTEMKRPITSQTTYQTDTVKKKTNSFWNTPTKYKKKKPSYKRKKSTIGNRRSRR